MRRVTDEKSHQCGTIDGLQPKLLLVSILVQVDRLLRDVLSSERNLN